MMNRNLMTFRAVLVLVIAAFAPACSGDDQGAGDEVGDTGQGDDMGDTGQGEDPTGDAGSEDDMGDTGETDEIAQLCEQGCELHDSCGMSVPGCVAGCIAGNASFEGECLDAQLAMARCVNDLSCEEIIMLYEKTVFGELDGPCASEFAQLCPFGCEALAIPSETGCTVEIQCGDLPRHDVQCDDQQCLCIVDGEQVGSCPLDQAICDLDVTAANTCCGWELDEAPF
jgi:hypothetical protein